MSDAEAIVVGGGPAGAAASIALARGGRRVLLLERDAAPREPVCGAFLGPDAAAALARLGLGLPGLGALPLRRLRLGAGGWETALDLPFPAWSLERRVLDGALREAARGAGATLLCGAAVRGAARDAAGWEVRTATDRLAASRLVLATGKHALRGHPREGAPPGMVGLKLHLRDVPLGAEVVLLPFAGGYAGLLPLPGGGANLCAAVAGEAAKAAARDLAGCVASGSALAARLLRAACRGRERPLAIGAVPYGFRQDPAAGPPGLFRVGDQLSVIPSFTGDGVAMALLSGLAAAEAMLGGAEAARFHAAWRRRSAGPMRWGAAGAWMMRRWPAGFAAAAACRPAARLLARRTRMEAGHPPG